MKPEIEEIVNAEIKTKTEGNKISVIIRLNSGLYEGTAVCHDEDLEFMSEKVGFNIAHLRAMIKCANAYKRIAIHLYRWECNRYRKEVRYLADEKVRAKHYKDYIFYRDFEKELYKQLESYLKAQQKALDSIRRSRLVKDAKIDESENQ